MNKFFITLAYSGLSPFAPGTVGTLVSLPLGVLILLYFDAYTLFLATALISIIAVKEINKYEFKTGIHDDKSIVIDELAGMWFALSVAPAIHIEPHQIFVLENGFLIQVILSFLLFRYFDIAKPSIIGRIDKQMPGGLGVMGDDIIAGFSAGIVSASLWQAILYIQTIF